jgi:hypothetical protein
MFARPEAKGDMVVMRSLMLLLVVGILDTIRRRSPVDMKVLEVLWVVEVDFCLVC